jgi:DNA-binding protein H-NS
MLHIVEKALDELESVPTEKREGLAHLDQEINEALEKLKVLKDKLKEDATGK